MIFYTCLILLLSVFYHTSTSNMNVRTISLKEEAVNISENNFLNFEKTASKYLIKFTSLKRLKTKLSISELPGKSKFYSGVSSNELKLTDFVYADLSYLKFLTITRMLC